MHYIVCSYYSCASAQHDATYIVLQKWKTKVLWASQTEGLEPLLFTMRVTKLLQDRTKEHKWIRTWGLLRR